MKVAIIPVVAALISSAAFAAEVRDQFAWVHSEGYVSLCAGPLWESTTSRGKDANLSFGRYVMNGVRIQCGTPQEFCGPIECYFIGTQVKYDDGKSSFYGAPSSSFPPNLFMLGPKP